MKRCVAPVRRSVSRSVTPGTPTRPLPTSWLTRPSTTPAWTTGMFRPRKRLGPGSSSALANAGTSSGEDRDSESSCTLTGSNGTMSHTRNSPFESETAVLVPTRTRTPGMPRSPGFCTPSAFSSRKTRPDTPERSSDGPGAVVRRPVARSHSRDPCTYCVPLTVPPAGALTVVYDRSADR